MTEEEVRKIRAESSRRHREIWATTITPGVGRANELIEAKKVKPPEHLLHFTSAAALASIIPNRTLRLSRARSSNDPKELDHALTLAREEQDNVTKNEGDEIFRQELLANFDGRLSDGTPRRLIDPHVCCFTETGAADLVAHWAMYGRDGSGFALKFKGKALDAMEDNEKGDDEEKVGAFLVKIAYDERKQRSHMRKLLAIGREASQNASDYAATAGFGDGWAKRSFMIAAQVFGGVISLHAATMKAPEFAAEKEWRLVNAGRSEAKPGVDANGPILRTYYDMNFDPDDLVSIIVGPIHADVNRPVVGRLLEDHGYNNTSVEIGKVALRTLRDDR